MRKKERVELLWAVDTRGVVDADRTDGVERAGENSGALVDHSSNTVRQIDVASKRRIDATAASTAENDPAIAEAVADTIDGS